MGAADELADFFACSALPKPKEAGNSGTLLEHTWVGIGGESCKEEGGEEGGAVFTAGGVLGGALSLWVILLSSSLLTWACGDQ